MNRTIEDSKLAIVVGGDTIVHEDGKLEMPPEQAKNTKIIIKEIEDGNCITIPVGNCKAEDILSKKQIEELKDNREERKTEKAILRKNSKQR